MPQALDPNYAVRIKYAKGRFKLQYRVLNELGEQVWVTACVVDEHDNVIGSAIEVEIETGTEQRNST